MSEGHGLAKAGFFVAVFTFAGSFFVPEVRVFFGVERSRAEVLESPSPHENVAFVEDFQRSTALIQSDGQIVSEPGVPTNRVMRLSGERPLSFSVPLKIPLRAEDFAIRVKVLAPTSLHSDDGKLHFRIRIYDHKGNSKVAFKACVFKDAWQSIVAQFQMDAQFLDSVMIEVVSGEGTLYFDDVEVVKLSGV